MLPKIERLTKKDINVFFSSKNKSVRGNIVSVRFQKSNLPKNRWAVVVSSSVKKNAYHRNTARRRIFSIIRELIPTFIQGFDVIVSLKLEQKHSPSSQEIKDDIIRTLQICKLSL